MEVYNTKRIKKIINGVIHRIYSSICFINSVKITHKHKKLSRHDFLNIATMEKLDKGKM